MASLNNAPGNAWSELTRETNSDGPKSLQHKCGGVPAGEDEGADRIFIKDGAERSGGGEVPRDAVDMGLGKARITPELVQLHDGDRMVCPGEEKRSAVGESSPGQRIAVMRRIRRGEGARQARRTSPQNRTDNVVGSADDTIKIVLRLSVANEDPLPLLDRTVDLIFHFWNWDGRYEAK